MMNRLLLPWQRRLLFVVGLIPWALALNAQCECGMATDMGNMQSCTGTNFTLTFTGQDSFYVEADCMEPLINPLGSFTVNPANFDTIIFSTGLTGFSLGAMIPGGTDVNMHYIIIGSGVSDTLCFTLSFLDTIPPQVNTLPSADTVACEIADYPTWLQDKLDQVTANSTDNCGVDTTYHNGPATFPLDCAAPTITVTFFAEDESGNKDSVMASYTLLDTVPPVFDSLPAPVVTINCDDMVPDPAMVTATDVCQGPILSVVFSESSSQTNNGSDTDNDYTILRTWQVSDDCGNVNEFTQTINVVDVTPPTFVVPMDTTITCDAATDTTSTGNISLVMDNCADLSQLTITMSETSISNGCPDNRTITRTWKVRDLNLNETTGTQTITVVDTVGPTADFPADITVDCADAADLNITGSPTNVADNCDATPTVGRTDVIVAGACEYSYTIERLWQIWDNCGDTTEAMQTITVTDNTPPVINNEAVNQTITCSMDIEVMFANWVNTRGAATANDNCTHSDSLTWVAYNSGTMDAASLPGPDCVDPDDGIFRTSTVDFIVTDKCGNRDTTTATFTVADNDAPTVLNCPTNMVIEADSGICEANRILPLPVVMENCGNVASPVSVSQTKAPTIPPGSNPVNTPIDDIVFELSVPAPPNTAAGNATLTILLNDIDAEAPTEFLLVFGEDGSQIGQVANTPTQCGDASTAFNLTAAQINEWAFDGTITITVKTNIPPNQSGIFAVNHICPNGTVTAELAYTSNFPGGLAFEYSIGNSGRLPVDPIADINEILVQGTNVVTYFFTDCAGNETTCGFEITVEDQEPPVLVCPADISINLAPGECDADVEIPLFSSVSDNCGVTTPTTQTQPTDPDDQLITYSYDPNLNDFVAEDKTFIFTGLVGNATPGGVQLIITLQGDVDSVGAYYEIYDNDGNLLGTTSNGEGYVTPGDCNNPSTATFTIPAVMFNDWAESGDILITAKSYKDYPIPPAGPGWGINPCDTSLVQADGDTDGSFIFATFSYESVMPTFEASGATTVASVTLQPPLEAATYNLAQGTTTFKYSLDDLAGNYGECTFDVTVTDTEAPTATCGPAFVDINPSGFEIDTIFPFEIDLNSFDNCTIDTMFVTPNLVDCDDEGIVDVVLTVVDGSGNVSQCSTFVNVTTQAPAPTANTPCGSNNLQLFTNPPASAGASNNIYTYTWNDPNGVAFAFVQNPVIQDANVNDIGFYTVTIEGVSGCQSTSSVQVTCNMLPLAEPVVQVLDNDICASETIQLSTASVCGTGVQYKWYSGNFPGVLMATTTQPAYTMQAPASGTFNFYVIVERANCASVASDPVSVTVNMAPTAMVAAENITICESEQILLNSINTPAGATCQWTGPAGFSSANCSPAPISNSGMNNAGFYSLVVTSNNCPSIPDTVTVNVIQRPPRPTAISSTSPTNPACDGESIILTATQVPGAVSYEWTSPMFTVLTSPSNVLTIAACDLTKDAGTWTVTVIGNPCESEPSEPFEVFIAPLPESVQAAANPIEACEGQTVNLTASSATQNVSFLWNYPNGQTNATANPVISNISNANNGTYNLTVTSQFGCSSTASVQVSVLDRVDITGVSSNVPSCPTGPASVQLVATLFPQDNGSYQYLWNGPNGYQSTNATATISGATSANNGPYILTVTNAAGCSSLPATLNVNVPQVLSAPVAPTTASGLTQFCEGQSVILNTAAYAGGTATYVWTTPVGAFSTAVPSLTLNGVTVVESGNYAVQYLVGDCTSAMSGNLNIQVNALPVVSVSTNSPVCEGATLSMTTNCTSGAQYEWTGPNGFSPGVCNPNILNAMPDLHSGTYTVRKKVNGCWSEVLEVEVEVKEKPAVPTAVNTGPFCANSDDVILSVTGNSATPGATYTWYDVNNVPLGSATPSLNFAVPNAVQYGNGPANFYVIATLDGCPSTQSVPTTVTLNTVPSNLAEAGPAINACEGDILTLQATPPTVGTGKWSLASGNPNGLTIANPDQATTTLAGIIPGDTYIFQWTLSNGACEGYSSDTAEVFVNFVEQAEAGTPITLCHSSQLTLNGNTPVSNVGTWSQPSSQALLGVVITEPGNPSSGVTGLVPGNQYIFTWTIDGGCGATSDQVLVTVTDENAFAGANLADCGDGCTTLAASPSANENGQWSSPDPSIEFIDNTLENSLVCNLQPGENILVWTIDGGICGQFSIDTVIVDYTMLPIALDDVAQVSFGGTATVEVTANDDIPNAFTTRIVEQPQHGTAVFNVDSSVTYTANENFVGEDFLVYEVCSDGCECVTATVRFNVGADAECIPPTIFTPNDDGVNDAFVIPCFENNDRFPFRAVSIFNQWGDEVFHAEPYQNDWEGTFDGQDLPAGTYFYFIDLGRGVQPLSGYLILQR